MSIAVAGSMLTAVCHMLRDGTEYADLGDDGFVRRAPDKDAMAKRLARRIRALGFQVDMKQAAA